MRRHEVGIMQLGGADRAVAEQLLQAAHIGAAGQDLDRERVAKAVGMSVHAGDLAEAGDGPPEALRAIVGVAVATPKKVVWIAPGSWKAFEIADRIWVQKDFDGDAVLLGPEHQVSGRLETGAAELGDVADAEPGIEERPDQGAGAPADEGRVRGPHAAHLVAGLDEFVGFLAGEGERRDVVDQRRLDELGRVAPDPLARFAEGAEGAEILDLFALGAGLDLARVAEAGDQVHVVELADRAGAAEVGELGEGAGVAADRARLEVALGAFGEVGLDGRGDRAGVGDRKDGVGVAGGREQEFDAAFSARPVGGLQGASVGLAVELAVDVDRAGAESEVPAAIAVGAGGGVAAVGVEVVGHGRNSSMDLYTILYSAAGRLQVVDLLGKFLGWVEGFEPLSVFPSLQLTDFFRSPNSLNSSGYIRSYICTRRQSCQA